MQRYGISDLGQSQQFLKKYPDLLASLTAYTSLKFKSEGRVLRRDTERIKRIKKFRRRPNLRLRLFENILFRTMDQQNLLFICPICRNVLKGPVTVDCGHTFCGGCLTSVENNNFLKKCVVCTLDLTGNNRSVNVLVQELVEKWRDRNKLNANIGKNFQLSKCTYKKITYFF